VITITVKIDESVNLPYLTTALNALGLSLHYTGRSKYVAVPRNIETVVIYEGTADPTPTNPDRHSNINRSKMLHHHRQIVGATPAGPPSE
jgi:hypothetical protein